MWRIYIGSLDSRKKLLTEGFDLNNINVRTFEINPFSAGTTKPEESVLKITVQGIPLSVDDGEILKMLKTYGCEPTSDIKLEKIRHPVTRKMTSILNGNRFIYVKPFAEGKFLPRISVCAGLKCRIFHYGQPKGKRTPLCTKCWDTTHYRFKCTNAARCKVCKQEGHMPGSAECPAYIEQNSNVTAFNGKNNPLSNLYGCQLNVFGMTFTSSEQAYQYAKAMRCGDVPKEEAIRECRTAMDAMYLGKTVMEPEAFVSQRIEVMTEVLQCKVDQVPEFKDILMKSVPDTIFVESTYEEFWGSGLNYEGTIHTDIQQWSGQNHAGKILCEIANTVRPDPEGWQSAKSAKSQDKKKKVTQSKLSDFDINELARELKTPRKRMACGRRKSMSAGNSRASSPGKEAG